MKRSTLLKQFGLGILALVTPTVRASSASVQRAQPDRCTDNGVIDPYDAVLQVFEEAESLSPEIVFPKTSEVAEVSLIRCKKVQSDSLTEESWLVFTETSYGSPDLIQATRTLEIVGIMSEAVHLLLEKNHRTGSRGYNPWHRFENYSPFGAWLSAKKIVNQNNQCFGGMSFGGFWIPSCDGGVSNSPRAKVLAQFLKLTVS